MAHWAQGTLLVLDEPTNHLDIPSKETLEEAVRSFEGALPRWGWGWEGGVDCCCGGAAAMEASNLSRLCLLPRYLVPLPSARPSPFASALPCAGSVIAVSHDRYFLRRIATRIVTVQDGKLVDYQGDYEVRRGGVGRGDCWERGGEGGGVWQRRCCCCSRLMPVDDAGAAPLLACPPAAAVVP